MSDAIEVDHVRVGAPYIDAGVYTLTIGDGKSAAELLGEVEQYYGVSHIVKKFVLSPQFRVQREPELIDLEVVLGHYCDAPERQLLAMHGLEVPTEEDAIRFALLNSTKRVGNTIIFPHLDNLPKTTRIPEGFFLGLNHFNFCAGGSRIDPFTSETAAPILYAGRRPGSKRSIPLARDWLLVS